MPVSYTHLDVYKRQAQDILDTFDIEDGGTIEKVWDMAKYVVAFEKWVKDEHLSMVASHYCLLYTSWAKARQQRSRFRADRRDRNDKKERWHRCV